VESIHSTLHSVICIRNHRNQKVKRHDVDEHGAAEVEAPLEGVHACWSWVRAMHLLVLRPQYSQECGGLFAQCSWSTMARMACRNFIQKSKCNNCKRENRRKIHHIRASLSKHFNKHSKLTELSQECSSSPACRSNSENDECLGKAFFLDLEVQDDFTGSVQYDSSIAQKIKPVVRIAEVLVVSSYLSQFSDD